MFLFFFFSMLHNYNNKAMEKELIILALTFICVGIFLKLSLDTWLVLTAAVYLYQKRAEYV